MLEYKCDEYEATLEARGRVYEIDIHRYSRRRRDFDEVEGRIVLHLCPECYERWMKLLRQSLGFEVEPEGSKEQLVKEVEDEKS